MELKDCQGVEIKIGSKVAYASHTKYSGTKLRIGIVNRIRTDITPGGTKVLVSMATPGRVRNYNWSSGRHEIVDGEKNFCLRDLKKAIVVAL